MILLAPVVIKTITSESGRGLCGDDCNNAFHEKCIPKYHKEHIHISEDEFLCHKCYKVKPSESSRSSNEKSEEEETDYDEYEYDDDGNDDID